MQQDENIINEYKSILKIRSGDKEFKSLAETCVALANSQGGAIYIGIDDKTKAPPIGQLISNHEVNDTIKRIRTLCSNVALTNSDILEDENGGQYFHISVAPSLKSLAATSDGKIYKRIGDECVPVRAEDIMQLGEEKGAYQWELILSKYQFFDIPQENIANFINDIRGSERVSEFIKNKSDIEILEHYNLIDGNNLTYIGVLWLGSAKQRARLSYPITVQYIVYNQYEEKIRKYDWHDNTKNPKELLLDIEREAKELRYSYEFADGLFRKNIPYYNTKIVRELLVNAFAHKSFTIAQDIIVAVYPDRLEITNSGGLPMGITANNILHKTMRRNPAMIEIMKAFALMEGEGSGYDLVYEINAMEAKEQPIIEANYNEVRIIQKCKIIDNDIIPLLDYVLTNYRLSQKGYIAFGTIASKRKILSTELSKILQLSNDERLRSYTDSLSKDNLILSKGVKKGTYYYINPTLIKNSNTNIKTTLKTIEHHTLKALILEDLKLYPNSRIKQILVRLEGVDIKDLRKVLYEMVDKGDLKIDGAKTNRTYTPK